MIWGTLLLFSFFYGGWAIVQAVISEDDRSIRDRELVKRLSLIPIIASFALADEALRTEEVGWAALAICSALLGIYMKMD